jgi:hypothetical protein
MSTPTTRADRRAASAIAATPGATGAVVMSTIVV